MNPEWIAAAVAAANAIADDLEAGLGRGDDDASFTLWSGDAGVALLFDALARAGHRPTGELRAREQLRSATRHVRAKRVGPSLYGGWPGLAFATSIVCEPGEARRSLAAATAALRRGVSTGPWRGRLDLTGGLVGLGVLALALPGDDDATAAAAAVVQRLDELARPAGDGVLWPIPEEPDQLAVGVAHGLAGIVLLLAAAAEAGVEQARSERLLDGAVDWLLALAPGADGRRFPAHAVAVPAAAETMPNAWCWGDVGVALAVARAARVRGRSDWRGAAVDAALDAARRDPSELGVADACFCHGSAGVAHVLRALRAVTGDDRLADPIRDWTDRTIASRATVGGIGGFTTALYPWLRDTERVAYGGLQLGAAGTGLALLAACGLAHTGWDQMFLIPSAP